MPDENYYNIVRIIYFLIFTKSITFSEISEKTGYSEEFFTEIIKGQIPISKKELKDICNALNISEEDLISDDEFRKINKAPYDVFNMFFNTLEK